ncbi:MAG: glycosyltransferase family 9 protein [Bacteroidota bacterium]|jgi:ADP-heptose:LPS heptosyltransferase
MLYGIKNAYKAFKTLRADKKALREFDRHAAYVKNAHQTRSTTYSNILLHLVDIGDYLTFRNFLPYYHQLCGDNTLFIGNMAFKPIYDEYDRTFRHTLWLDKKTIGDYAGRKAWLNTLSTLHAEHVYMPAYNANGFPDLLSLLAFTDSEKIIPLHGGDSFQQHFLARYSQHTTNNSFIGSLRKDFLHEFLRNKEIAEALCDQKIQLEKPYLPVTKKHSTTIVVFCGANHKSKIWPASHYAAVIRAIETAHPQTYEFVLSGSVSERGMEKAIADILSTNVKNLTLTCGKTTLPELIQQIADACLLISPDTVAQHIAASTTTPCVVYSNGVNYYRFISTPETFSHMHHAVPPLFIKKGYPLWRFAPSSLVSTIQPDTVSTLALGLLNSR